MLKMISGFFMGIWNWIVNTFTYLWVLTYSTISSLPWKEIGFGAVTLFLLYIAYEFFLGDDGIL